MNDINTANLAGTTPFPLATASLAELGLHAPAIDRLRALVKTHIVQGRYPGAQIALARHGKLALFETFGHATLEPKTLATDSTRKAGTGSALPLSVSGASSSSVAASPTSRRVSPPMTT